MSDRKVTQSAGSRGMAGWLAVAAAVVGLGVAVPYGPMARAAPGLGLALFWLGFGLAVIVLVAIGVLRWKVAP